MSLCLLKAWARDWRRTLSIALGVILAISLFAGINISIDSARASLLEALLANVPVDAVAWHDLSTASWDEVSEAISSVDLVEDVLTVIGTALYPPEASLIVNGEQANMTDVDTVLLLGIPKEPTDRLSCVFVNGSWDLGGQKALVSYELAQALGLGVGDEVSILINLSRPGLPLVWTSPALSITGIAKFSSEASLLLTGEVSRGPIGPFMRFISSREEVMAICVSQAELEALVEDLASTPGVPLDARKMAWVAHYIWSDRAAVIDPWNLDATKQRIAELRGGLEKALQAYDVRLEVNLELAISFFSIFLDLIKPLTGALSLPVFLLCWYLALTAGYLVSSARRREIGLLRVRGASSKRILMTYLATSALIGALGGILGAALGVAMGFLYNYIVGGNIPLFVLLSPLYPVSLLIETCAGAIFCLIANIGPARLASKLSPLEAAREYVEAEAVGPWRPSKLTIILFALGTIKMVEWGLGISPMDIIRQAPNLPFFLSIALLVWAIFDDSILTLFGPIFFVYGLTKLLTRSSKRLYEVASLLAKPLGEVREIVSRSLARNPARAARVALLISIALAYSAMTNLVAASIMDAQVRTAMTAVGSDVRVEVAPELGPAFALNICQVAGVRQVTPLAHGAYIETKVGHMFVSCYAINATEFMSVAYYEEDFCQPSMSSALLDMASSADRVLISSALAEQCGIGPGDTLYIRPLSWLPEDGGPYRPVVVSGILRVMPGGPTSPFMVVSFIVVSFELARELDLSFEDLCFLVKVEEGAEPEDVAKAIEGAFPLEVLSTRTVDEELRESPLTLVGMPICDFLNIAFAYSLVAATLGLGLTAMLNVREKTYEVGLMRARGLRRRQVVLALAAEALIIALIGFLIGIATGIISASGITGMVSDAWPIPVRLVAPTAFWALLAIGIGLFVASSILPAVIAFRKTVVETIRFR